VRLDACGNPDEYAPEPSRQDEDVQQDQGHQNEVDLPQPHVVLQRLESQATESDHDHRDPAWQL